MKVSVKSAISRAKLITPEYKRSIYEQVEDDKKLEDRTGICCKRFGRLVNRSERLIKLVDSWFSAKYMSV